eukprot:CAMPEP_0177754336 /NCGR_PEP_ID=MMETSP0491_2-20121128/1955_1 /TAXON_ID=63592 /ORGANISM="Tetraselmis chuii, Strain PLY429" /LENGTH=146 /DNA_ID=CAMNT_0019269713 /DNA_START=1331 /DNA_END=1770 /DNA_ORIENTATION=-
MVATQFLDELGKRGHAGLHPSFSSRLFESDRCRASTASEVGSFHPAFIGGEFVERGGEATDRVSSEPLVDFRKEHRVKLPFVAVELSDKLFFLSGLSFCGRVETNFDAGVFEDCEEFIDAIGVAVGCLSAEEAGVYDSLLSSEGRF